MFSYSLFLVLPRVPYIYEQGIDVSASFQIGMTITVLFSTNKGARFHRLKVAALHYSQQTKSFSARLEMLKNTSSEDVLEIHRDVCAAPGWRSWEKGHFPSNFPHLIE